MILPIVAFGSPILRSKCENISNKYHELDSLLSNMWETMYEASGVGLAAPQINKAIRLFLIDTAPFFEDQENSNNDAIKKVFINPRIIEEKGDDWDFNEGSGDIVEDASDNQYHGTVYGAMWQLVDGQSREDIVIVPIALLVDQVIVQELTALRDEGDAKQHELFESIQKDIDSFLGQ